jgi:hypothetical protein
MDFFAHSLLSIWLEKLSTWPKALCVDFLILETGSLVLQTLFFFNKIETPFQDWKFHIYSALLGTTSTRYYDVRFALASLSINKYLTIRRSAVNRLKYNSENGDDGVLR